MFRYSQTSQGIISNLQDSYQLYMASIRKLFAWFLSFSLITQSLLYYSQMGLKTGHLAGTEIYLIGFFSIVAPLFLTPILAIIAFYFNNAIASQITPTLSISHLLRLYYLRVLGANFLLALCGFLIGILLLVVPFLIMSHNSFMLISLFFIFIVFVGVAITPYLLFYRPFIVINNLAIIESIKASFRLAHQSWWHIMLTILIPGVLFLAIYGAMAFLLPEKGLINLIAKTIVTAVIAPAPYAIILVLFNI